MISDFLLLYTSSLVCVFSLAARFDRIRLHKHTPYGAADLLIEAVFTLSACSTVVQCVAALTS